MKKIITVLLLVFALCGCAKRAAFHAEYDRLIREATTSRQRQLYTLDYRLLCDAERNELEQRFSLSDGVDQFEAWLLAKTYASENFGACKDMDPPEKEGGRWVIRLSIGREARGGPPMYVDVHSGRLSCEGYPTVENPTEFLARSYARFNTPNKPAEPTRTTVTPPARAGDRASGARGSP